MGLEGYVPGGRDSTDPEERERTVHWRAARHSRGRAEVADREES